MYYVRESNRAVHPPKTPLFLIFIYIYDGAWFPSAIYFLNQYSSTVSFCYEKIKSLEFDYAVVACSILIKPELLNTMPEVRFSTHASTLSKLQDKLTRRHSLGP